MSSLLLLRTPGDQVNQSFDVRDKQRLSFQLQKPSKICQNRRKGGPEMWRVHLFCDGVLIEPKVESNEAHNWRNIGGRIMCERTNGRVYRTNDELAGTAE